MITRINDVEIDKDGDVVVIAESSNGKFKFLEMSVATAKDLILYLTEMVGVSNGKSKRLQKRT